MYSTIYFFTKIKFHSMRSLILSLLFVAISVVSYGQAFESCADSQMPGNTSNLVIPPTAMTTLTIDPLWTVNADLYAPSNLAPGFATAYWSFTVSTMGAYFINIEGAPASPSIGADVSMSLGTDCLMLVTGSEIFAGVVPANLAPETATCTVFNPGTTYTIALAIDPAFAGDIIISIANNPAGGASNENCAGAVSLLVGTSVGNNSCSDGLVWYSYTVMNGGDVDLATSMNMAGNGISAPEITQTSIDGCSTFQMTTSWICIPVGTVINFEVGDNMSPVEQGDFDINITDDNLVTNEVCDDVTPAVVPSCVTTSLTSGANNTTIDACPELINFDGCNVFNNESTVWFGFITDADAQFLDVDVSPGFSFVVIDGTAGCPVGAATLAGCQITGSLVGQVVLPNTTYYIAVATNAGGTDGTFLLTVTPQNPPTNDDCTTGALDISLASANPANVGVSGTTTCATPDANDFCTTVSEDHVVYYEYTVDPAILTNRDVIITIVGSGGNAATNMIFGLFEDCIGTAYTNPVFSGDECDVLNGGAVTYKCVEPGTVLTIAVGSPNLSEGDFTITITEDATMLAVNDACADATGLSVGMACVPTLETVPNDGGCPEMDDLGTSCLFSSDKTVWHTITLPAGADEIEFTALGTDVQLALFENTCIPLTLLGGDCFTADMTFTGLTPGGTYLLAASLAGAIEGDMTFTWTPIIPITNEDCDVLTNPVLTDLALLNGTTGCADSDLDFCGTGADGHDVYYTYTNMTSANTNITITINGNILTTGTAATEVSVGIYEDCLTTMYAANECNTLGIPFTIECVQPLQQLVFIIGSPDGSEGDFGITLTEDATTIAANDLCSGATALQVGTTCETTIESVTNVDACPEAIALGVVGCDLTTDAVAWYSLVMPTGATELDFSALGANVQLSLFNNVCPNPTVITSVGGNTCITADDEFSGLAPGSSYFVAVSLAAQAEGAIDFSWTPGIVVANDDCDAVNNPALTAGTAVNGTTACADGEFDFCGLLNGTSHGVFYTYTNGTTGNVDLDITVSGNILTSGTAMTGLEIAILSDCAGAPYQPLDCTAALGGAYNVDCIAPGDQIIIYIASADGAEGDFSITVTEDTTQPTDDNDNCIDALAIDASILTTCQFYPISGSTAEACPEDFTVGGCTYNADATVWYSFTTPNTTNPLTVEIQSITGGAYATIFNDNCAALVVVAGCDTGAGPFGPYTVASNTTYLIAVGDATEGAHSFDIKINELPANDDPCMAQAVVGTAGDMNITVSGTTVCATQDYLEPTCGADNENTVWYEYTVPSDATGFEITISGVASSIAVGAFGTTACGGGTPTLLDPSIGVSCDAASNPISFQCLTPGTTVYVYVGTSDTNSGTFDITFDPLVPDPACIDNDLCADADVVAFAGLVTDGGQVCIDDCNIGACPESFMSGACDYSMWPTVFYSVTTDALAIDATMSVNLSGINGTIADPIFSIYTSCAAGAVDPASECIQSGTLSGLDIMPSTTYIIAVALEDAAGGEFQLCVTISTTCNDDPCTPFPLVAEVMPTECTTTVGASDETFTYDDGGCADMTTSEATVYYTYTPSEGISEATITFTNDPATGITGDMIFTVVDYDPATCSMEQTTILGQECGPVGGIMPITITCPTFNVPILIQIGSTLAGAGEFDIVVNETMTLIPNDICSSPDVPTFLPGLACEWMDAQANSLGACPESFDYMPGCGFDDFPVVWFEATAPAGATGLDIRVIAAAAGIPFIGAFTGNPADCDNVISGQLVDCQTGTFADLDAAGEMLIDVMPGDVILFAIGTNDPLGSVTIDFSIKWNVPPANDECNMAVTLSDEVSTSGSTACATEEMPLFVSGACAVVNQENTVWYEVTVPAGSKGFTITATTAGLDGFVDPMNIVVFETESTACDISATSLIDEVCVNSGEIVEDIFECVGAGTYVIRLSTSGDNEGDFDVVVDILDGVPNDICDDPNQALNPGLECEWMETQANSIGACPEDPFLDPGCGLSVGAVVWYEITAPANATFLDIRLTSGNGANPMIAVFPGNPADCDMQTILPGSICYDGTFTDLVTNGNTLIPVTGGDTYLIAVGVTDPNGSMIDFGIKWITPPVNDECADAITLAASTPEVGTTACATQESPFFNGACPDADETNTVWYEYTVPAGDKGFNITISASGVAPFTAPITTSVFETTSLLCDISATSQVGMDNCTASAAQDLQYECVGEGTYLIRISTSSANEGDFEITIEPLAIVQPNDNCDAPDAVAFTPALECEWMVIAAETVGACPEDMNLDGPGCGLDDFPVTWYEVTAPANAEFLDLQINFGGANPFIAVFEAGVDCDNLNYVAGTTCYGGTFDELNDLGQAQIDITPSTTYLIAIGTDAMAGGTINFGIKWITPPDNDECVNAEDFDNLMPSGNPGEFSQTLIMETTQCATGAITGTACDDDNTNTVWYTYTVEPDVKEITIDITNWMNTVVGGTPDLSLTVLDGCVPGGAIITQADGSSADYCGGEGTDLITLSCLDEGDVITILVSSSSENEGTFDITINTAEPDCVYTNDECPDAVDFGVVIMDDPIDCIFLPGCNDLACTEFDFSTVCPGIDVLNSVFYTFTTDDLLDVNGMPVDAAFVNLEIISGQAGELDNPGAILLSGDCNSPAVIGACAGTGGGGEFNSGPLGMPGQIMPNTTYTVVVYNSNDMQNGGTFDLCITVTSGCVNDDICDAFTLEPGVTIDNPASSNNCTDDFVLTTGCDNTLSAATLWYQIEVPAGASSIIVTLNNQLAPDGVEGEVSIAVGPLVDCNALDVNDILYEDCMGFATNVHEIDCAVEFGTYWIQIGSDDEMESGDFTIEYTFSSDGDPVNDLCTEATDLVVNEYCEFTTFGSTLKEACAELFDVGPCEFSMNQAVWFTITIPSGDPMITDMDIMIDGLANPMIGVFEFECMDAGDPSANNGIINAATNADGPVDCSQMPLTEGITVVPGTTYHILVSTSSMEDIVFDISIKLNAPPINDDPCITQNNPPIDLSGGGSHAGTTCCARGPKDEDPLGPGGVADYENVDCSAQTEDASVWYTYIPDENDDGYNIILEDGGANGPMSLEYYFGPADGGCTGNLTLLGSSCNSNTADIKIGNCFAPGDVLFVKVTTDDADTECGDFIITIIPASCGEMSDDCIDTADSDPLMPVTPPNFDIVYSACVTGCLDYACPEDDAMGGCGEFTQAPTVWFQVETDMDAAQMFTTVEAFGNWDPIWSIWSGTSCDDLEIVNFGGAPPCSNGDATPLIHQIGVFTDVPNYWIAITLDPNSLPSTGLDDGSFELCIATSITAIICLGEEIGDCTDPSLVMEVTDREVEDQPLTGPFCQGEEVTINIAFDYDASESGADWLIGMVPIFGDGWDLTAFDYADNAPVGNGQTAEWFEEAGDCAPIIQEPNPILCTFVNANGDLTLCNQLCDPCSDCPQSGMMEGDPLPSGYFWVSNGGNAGCDNDCSPGEGWGIGSTQASIVWEFTLTVKTFTDPADCFEEKDLSISFQTFSDGVGGCWEDPVGECILDRAMFSPAWEIECEAPPAIEGPDQEICHDGTVDIDVATADGSTTQIQVDVEDNPNVTGEMSHTFEGGFGNIDDDLLNLTNDIQIVIYNVYAVDPSLPCPGVVNQIEVTLYPELMVTFPPVFICEGDCTDITPDIGGGFGAPFMYEWSTGETTASINVCPVVPTTYFVTVTDGLGCEDVGDVEVDVKPPVELLLPPSISVCKDDNFDPFNPDYVVCLDFISGSSPFGITWVPEMGLAGQPIGSGDCFAINELLSSEFLGSPLGTYTLTANVTDFFGCMGTTDMEVIITGELTIVAEVNPYNCGETEATMNITGLDAAGNPVTTFILYGGCPDDGLGDFIDEFFSNSGTVLTPTLNLLDYTCYTIVAQTESGCQATIDIEIPLTEGTPIDIGGDEFICIGSDATITIANEGDFVSFVWAPDIGTTGSITFTPDSTATYIVEATDAADCVSQALWTVTVNPEPTISLAGALEFCEFGSATITASGGGIGGTYAWTGVAGDQAGASYTTGVAGDATVTVTDVNGCVNDSTITFAQVDVIEIILANSNICDGMGDTLFVPTNIIDVIWEDATPMPVSDTTFYIITTSGTFTVTGQDATTGCDAAGSFTVEEFFTPIINIPDTVEVCRLDSGIDSLCINLTGLASGSSGGTWNQAGIIPGFDFASFPQDNVCFDSIQTGCYPFTFTTNSATMPCMDIMATMMVCVKACPCPSPATQSIPDICNFGTYNLEIAELTTDPGTWSVQSGPLDQDISGIISGTVFTATGILPGPYLVRFTLDNPGGGSCEMFSEQIINVIAQDVINVLSQGQLCNIVGQQFPTTLDLFDLISVDASNGGTWVQTGTETLLPITGGSMISSADIVDFAEIYTFEYTSGATGGPCPLTVTEVTVDIFDCTCPIVIVGTDTLCNNGVAIDLFTLLTNDDNLTGTWTTNGNLTGVSMFDPNGLPSGAYDITFTLDSSPGAGCEVEYSNTIIVRRRAVAVMQPGPQPCTMDTGNGPTTVNLYSWLVPGYTLGSWSQIGGDVLPLPDDGNSMAVVDFMNQDIGETFTYVFTTVGAQIPCQNTSVTIVITVVDCNCPPIMITDQDPVCNDSGMIDLCALVAGSDPGTFVVTSAGGTAYPDRIDATGCIFDAVGLNQGTYTITYTLDAMVTGTCIGAVSTSVEIINYVSTEIVMIPDTVCSDPDGNGIMVLNFTTFVGNAGSGVWADDDGAGVIIATISDQQNVSFVGVPAGSYDFTYTIDNEEPCTDPSLTITVEVIDDCNCAPINPADPADVCSTDGPVDLTQYDDVDMPGTWSSTDLTIENGNSLITDGVLVGVYTLTYTLVTLIPDCPESTQVMILIGEPANSGIPEDLTLCEGDAQVIILDDRLTDADLGGVWTETSATMSTGFSGNSFDTDGQAAGTYTFQYDLTENSPCPDVFSTVTVIIDPNPVADAGSADELDCVNISEDLEGDNTSTGSDFVYSWTLDGVEVGTDASLLGVNVEGTYQLLVTNSVTGCVDSSSVTVTKSDAFPEFIVDETNITCNGDNDGFITISGQNGGDGNYTYSLNGGTAVSDPGSFIGLAAGDYTIAIIDGIGCTNETAFTILEPDPVSVVISADGLVDGILKGEPGDEFILTIDPVAENIDSVVWSDFNDPMIIFCSGSVAECLTVTIAPTLNTTVIYVEAFDANGCPANDQVQIQLNQIVDVTFPNIISPNGDNINDFFFIASDDVEQILDMKIFDRWGELIWEKQNFDPRVPSEGWDGKFNDSAVVPGVFVFTVEVLFNDLNSTTETFSGDVTVTDGD
ncbi:MAG: gliding motility-associated-like protein [Saprospiraceae bacterium]